MPVLYTIHSVARGRHNRTARASLPQNPRMKQHITGGQRRLIPGRPIQLTEAQLLAHLDELKAKAAAHVLEVKTQDGRVVDLNTLEPGRPPTAERTRPNVRPDSVADDKNFAWPKGQQYVPDIVPDDNTVPQIVPTGDKPALMKEAQRVADEEALGDPEDMAITGEQPAVMTAADEDAALDDALKEAMEGDDAQPEEGAVEEDSGEEASSDSPDETPAPVAPDAVSSKSPAKKKSGGRRNR